MPVETELLPLAGCASAASETSQQIPTLPPSGYSLLKVVVDFCLALMLFVLNLPLMLLIALAVKITSPGPIVYSQTRLGRNGRPYTLYKIRTMTHNCEQQSGPLWSRPGDPRITRLGKFLRRTHLDELPQLWNVLRGEMSLVGPRPERPEFVPGLEKSIPRYRERLLVKPGVTGLAQVRLPADTDLDSVRRKLLCDLHYVENLSFWLDVRIILATALKMLGVPFQILIWAFALPAPLEVTQAEAAAQPQVPEPHCFGSQPFALNTPEQACP